MAVVEIHAKRARLGETIAYIINPAKTDGGLLTRYQNCCPQTAYDEMYDTKRRCGKTDGVQGYHVIQSFKKGEVTPEQALEIGAAFAERCFGDYEAVIATHTDTEHIHNHIVFNSVSCVSGRKYHSSYATLKTLRAASDELCAERELSVIDGVNKPRAVSYIEWLRQQKGLPTLRSMLEADIKESVEDANDFGHFLLLMEHKGYEVKHGKQLSFKPLGAQRFMRGGVSEDDVREAIAGSFEAIERGEKPLFTPRPAYTPYRAKTQLSGFVGMYVHYLYLLGKVERRQYPPRMTPQLKQDLMRFEQLKAQYEYLQDNNIATPVQLREKKTALESKLTALEKRRTIFNVKKKKHRMMFKAVATAELYAPLRATTKEQQVLFGSELAQLEEAEAAIKRSDKSAAQITESKRELYAEVADVNGEIRRVRKEIQLCEETEKAAPVIERQMRLVEPEVGRARGRQKRNAVRTK